MGWLLLALGGTSCFGPHQWTGGAGIAQESALRRVRRRIAAFGDRPADLDGAGALQELLKTRGVYGGLDSSTTV
eukprot:6831835-Pyramimonas_sp.AAC.1